MAVPKTKVATEDEIAAEQRALEDAQQKTSEDIAGMTSDEQKAHDRLDAQLTDTSGDKLSELQRAYLGYKGHRPGSDAYVRTVLNPLSLVNSAEFIAFRAGYEAAGGKASPADFNAQYELMVAVHGRNEAMGPPSTVTAFGVPQRVITGDVVTSANPADLEQARTGVNPKAGGEATEQSAGE